VTFECSQCSHRWKTTPNNIKSSGSGCPICNGGIRTKDGLFNRLLNNAEIKLIGRYVNNYTKTTFRCKHGHLFQRAPSLITAATICPECKSHTVELINEILLKNDRGIICVGQYNGDHKKTWFKCQDEHKWEATPNNVIKKKSGCPACASHGFDPFKPAWSNVLIFDGFIKYGISNNINHRLYRHTKNGEYIVANLSYYADGKLAREWEDKIKKVYGGRFVNKERCPDGWTETLTIELLDVILEMSYNY